MRSAPYRAGSGPSTGPTADVLLRPLRCRTEGDEGTMTATVDTMIGVEVVGRIVKRKLGEGGMGAVYLAEHPLLTSKPYVVKVLHLEYAARADIVDRLFQEAQTASAIPHPTIINIIDCSRLADGRPYIVMEYVPGVDLQDYAHAIGEQWGHPGRLPIELATPIVLQLLDGLRAAHERGVIHRDLKPANLMVVQN